MPSLPVIGAYRIDIQQGNLVTQDMVEKLQPGMTRSQVRFVLGTPLVTDVFHADRWDYVYRLEKAGKLVENRHIVAVFDGDKLVRVEGDVVPGKAKPKPVATSAPAAGSAPGTPPVATPAPAAASAPVPGAAPEAKPAPASSGDSAATPEAKSAPAPSGEAASPGKQ
jgi:outer membrane protein assembly factor BamE